MLLKLFPNEQCEIQNNVLSNSKKIAKMISKKFEFAVIINAKKTNQTILTPDVKDDMVFFPKSKQ